jgi:hypothetical protein
VIFDPFLGSGTTLVAAGALDRAGFGSEISPGCCDVILQRAMDAFGVTPTLAATGETFTEVARAREVPADAAADLRAADSKSIRRKPNGMPCYGPQRKRRETVAQTV